MSFEMKCAVSQEQQGDQHHDLEVAPVPTRQDFPGRSGNDEREKADVNRCGWQPSDVGGNRHDDASGDPDQNKRKQRSALDRKPPRPVRDSGEQKARDHRRQVAVEHLMDMPVPRRERRMQQQLTVENRKPNQDGKAGIDASEQEKRPKAIGQQGGTGVGAKPRHGGSRGHACFR